LLCGPSAVGVDIEIPGRARIADLDHVLSPGALDRIAAESIDPTEVWMQVEAVVKIGSGGIQEAKDLVFEDSRTVLLRGKRVYLQRVRCTPRLSCWCAMTVPWPTDAPRIYQYETEELAELLVSPADRRICVREGKP
jgi:hypothetical protein